MITGCVGNARAAKTPQGSNMPRLELSSRLMVHNCAVQQKFINLATEGTTRPGVVVPFSKNNFASTAWHVRATVSGAPCAKKLAFRFAATAMTGAHA